MKTRHWIATFLAAIILCGARLPESGVTHWSDPNFLGQFFGGVPVSAVYIPTVIKSIQRGTITISGATSSVATITSVNTSAARLRYLGQTYSFAGTQQTQTFTRLALTNATTVTATVGTSPGANTTAVSYEVTEYYPGFIKSVQRGTITGSATATITSVSTAKSELDYLGHTESASDGITQYQPNLVLTNSTTVTQNVTVSATTISGYQVLEWK